MTNLYRRDLLRGAAAMALLAAGPAGAQSATPMLKITVAGAGSASSATPFFAALRRGFFAEAGLEVSYMTMAGAAAARAAAIQSGEVHIGIGAAAMWMGDIARKTVKGKLIGEFTDNYYVIMGTNGVTDVTQLRGKNFGISAHNAGDHLYVMGVLAHYGIAADEVGWVPLGEPAARLAALEKGLVDGVQMLLTGLPDSAKDKIILDNVESPLAFVGNALFASEQMLTEHHDEVARFMAAVGKGADWIRANPDEAVADCMDSGAKEEACKGAIAFSTGSDNKFTWSSTGELNLKAIEQMIPVIASTVPGSEGMKVEDFVDTTVTEYKMN